MNHLIVDREARMLPNWRDAMPAAAVVSRRATAGGDGSGIGIRWCRLRTGERLADVLPHLPAALPGYRTVILADEPSDALTLESLSAGAAGCCNTHAAPEVLTQVALVVANGGLWVGQSLLQQVIGNTTRALAQRGKLSADDPLPGLSEREQQVARLVAAGASNKEIADRLQIAERTVKAHLTAIFEKTGARDRLQLSLRINGVKL